LWSTMPRQKPVSHSAELLSTMPLQSPVSHSAEL